ncbi:unnamed protein product [Pieris macdunnoughi]|uniref:DUF7869 domain-containing protein n=1 Tax=Pieris macdunnoughi TaxID=345717 RepID=A0A821X0N8_9NEOP|nr:unnamed protein product [Pieris macdunnoughi]
MEENIQPARAGRASKRVRNENQWRRHVTEVKRRRPRTGTEGTRQANYSTKLFIKKRNSSTLLHVCQSSFLGILQIPRNRIRRVAETFKKTGGLVKENRGGDHTSHKNVYKLQEVKSFIESLQCIESHYCRSTTERKYLDSTLNIKKLWQIYNEQAVNTVKQCYFRRIFTTQYNIGFGNPRTDVCSKCTELEEQIKNEKNESVKAKYMIEKTIHKRKAKKFYQLLNQRQDGMITLSFDCQKNQVLPKLPDQITYYSRQLYIYNFAVVLAVEGKRLNKDTVTLYTWNENEYKKGANEIASGVYHRLNALDLNGIETLRLVADGCGAQNKNSIFIGMCCVWLWNAPNNIKNIELVFPIPGHSFLPADRVFGNVERELKRKEVIVQPEEYHNIFNKYGLVVQMEMVYDWKNALHDVIKPPGLWHFQFAQNVLPLPVAKNNVIIKKDKISDVRKLLEKHYGSQWESHPELEYYKKIINEAIDDDIQENEPSCDPPTVDSYIMI